MSQHPAFEIIVIGASAGGVSAFLKLAASLPPNFPCPILIVQHIGLHRSRLAELLGGKGPSRAVNAEDGVVPAPGTIYVAPADHHMLLKGGRIQLSRGAKENHARPAIDPLFRSAALEYGNRAIGVVLTGLLDDGAAGLRAIKDCGGITVVQDVQDALEASMPLSALASTEVDYTVTISKLAALLGQLVSSPPQRLPSRPPRSLVLEHAASRGENAMENLHAIGKPSVFSCPDCGGVTFELAGATPARFRCHTGHAFSLLSLTVMQEELADEALWTALRAMQEKEAGLRRLAESTPTLLPRHSELLAEASALAAAASTLRTLTAGDARFAGPARAPSSSNSNQNMERLMTGNDKAGDQTPQPVEVVARTEAGSVAVTPVVEEPAVDNGIEESFPASDPVSVSITKVLVASDDVPEAAAHAGAAADAALNRTADQPAGAGGREPSAAALPLNPGDEAAPGTPGTAETFCPVCGGSGRQDGHECAACGGTGQVTVGIGGA